MNFRHQARLFGALGLAVALSGCVPDIQSPGAGAGDVSPERAQAIAEMRAKAAAGETMAYPDAFQSTQLRDLASRPEPLPEPDVEAIQVELALIAEKRAKTSDAREIAALEARARELRRLALMTGTEPVRR